MRSALPALLLIFFTACAATRPVPPPSAIESFVTMSDGVRLFVRATGGT
jgi:hypothetical protein